MQGQERSGLRAGTQVGVADARITRRAGEPLVIDPAVSDLGDWTMDYPMPA